MIVTKMVEMAVTPIEKKSKNGIELESLHHVIDEEMVFHSPKLFL